MFTGIVLEKAQVAQARVNPAGTFELSVTSALPEARNWALGSSVAINGLCLTIVDSVSLKGGQTLRFEVSTESLACSNLGDLHAGDWVHVEPALALGAALGGHLVSGHVDAVAPVRSLEAQGDFWKVSFTLQAQARLRVAPFLVPKGSIAVDGVSLTLNGVADTADETVFDVLLIPHTLQVTRFGQLQVGSRVNLEADLLAKYVNRYQKYQETYVAHDSANHSIG